MVNVTRGREGKGLVIGGNDLLEFGEEFVKPGGRWRRGGGGGVGGFEV